MGFLEEHWDSFFKKYNDYELLSDINSYNNGSGDLKRFLRHFFDELIYNSKGHSVNMSPIEYMQDDSLMAKAFEKISKHPKIFYGGSDVQNVRDYFRIVCKKAVLVSNFSPVVARDIYFRYFPEYKNELARESLPKLNMLDTSCGFGSRMCSVLLSGQNYYGTDPNKKLNLKLNECLGFLRKNHVISNEQVADIRCTGSEVFIPEWQDKMDVMFTSPPYFNYEYYSDDGFASTNNYNDYRSWLRYFVVPTFMNVRKYLKSGGYIMINIKDFSWKKENLFTDFKKILTNIGGFSHVEDFNITTGTRRPLREYGNFKYWDDNIQGSVEPVMSFQKI